MDELWICLVVLVLVVFLFGHRLYFLTKLTSFTHDTNPLDFCDDLNSGLRAEVGLEVAVGAVSILIPPRFTLMFSFFAALLVWLLVKYLRGTFAFRPVSIVRDLAKHQIECALRLLGILAGLGSTWAHLVVALAIE